MVTDFKDMWRIGGRNVVFAGYFPYFLTSVLYSGQVIVKQYQEKAQSTPQQDQSFTNIFSMYTDKSLDTNEDENVDEVDYIELG